MTPSPTTSPGQHAVGRARGGGPGDRWLRVAAPVPGWMGFAIGRSIWPDPLRAREGTLTEPEPVP